MMMVVMMMTMMPSVPAMMVMVVAMEMMTVVSPVHFRRRQPGIFLNGRRSGGIAERQRVRALDRGCEREHCANGRKA
jgi:hypothetical protein